MGNPQHYSIELPGRCLELIEGLWQSASNLFGGERPDLGPLTSTFLISMSMPILIVPLERIERNINKVEGKGYVDDRHLNDKSVAAFKDVIQAGSLGAAPFFQEGNWRFYSMKERPFPNIANGLPEAVADALGKDEAADAARNMKAAQWISILRNAMAHGGIAYLDENGRSSHGRPVKMFAFVSGKYGKPKCEHVDADCKFGTGELEGLNLLRISEADFKGFLTDWVAWLKKPEIAKLAAA